MYTIDGVIENNATNETILTEAPTKKVKKNHNQPYQGQLTLRESLDKNNYNTFVSKKNTSQGKYLFILVIIFY